MIRQAHTYLVSAMSGATLIAIAIVVFVLLVSAQVFRDWPIAALGESDSRPHISDSRAAAQPAAAATRTSADAAASAKAASTGSKAPTKGSDQAKPSVAGGDLATSEGPASPAETPTGNEGGGPSDGGNQAGSNAPSSSPAGSSNPGSSSSSSGGKSSSGSGAASTPSAKATETVNNTVNQVDETVAGGSLGKSGVTEATEGVVDGVAGPESAVGKVVDETVKPVGGLLGGKP